MKSSVLLTSFLLFTHFFLAAQPGSPDPSFGIKGLLTNPQRKTYAKAIVSGNDKKILIGSSGFYQGYNTFLIDRLLPDGSPDTTFGTNGSTYILFSEWDDVMSSDSYIMAMNVLPDNRIIAAGYANCYSGTIAIACFLPDGTPDTTFGNNGASLTGFQSDENISAIALQPDGKILVGGNCFPAASTNGFHLFTARYLPDGNIDSSYGSNGIVISKSSGAVNAIALQPDGKIVAAGYSVAQNKIAFHIERYNSNGAYDSSFGKAGIVNNRPGKGTLNFVNDVVIDDSGKLLVAGRSDGTGTQSFTVGRYKKDGVLDKNFGSNGYVTTPFKLKTGEANKIMITGENQNRILVAGSSFSTTDGGDFVLVAYRKNGSPDSTFGTRGIQVTDFGGSDFVNSGLLQSDGKIILLGSNNGIYPYAVQALARYNGYPVTVPLYVMANKWANTDVISWNGLPAEDHIALYSVQQSSNAQGNFVQIANLPGVDGLKKYSFTNTKLLPETNYYRIKATGKYGSVTYSEVVSLANAISLLHVYPNPVRDYITLYGLKTDKFTNISITDGSGNVRMKGVSNGNNQYRTSTANWLPGNYYIHITTEAKTEIIHFIKQ